MKSHAPARQASLSLRGRDEAERRFFTRKSRQRCDFKAATQKAHKPPYALLGSELCPSGQRTLQDVAM